MEVMENLVRMPGSFIECPIACRKGQYRSDPRILLQESIPVLKDTESIDSLQLWRSFCYDTYTIEKSGQPVSFTIRFPKLVAFNCIEITMGFIRDYGGWWTSLDVLVLEEEDWIPVRQLQITPPYNFQNEKFSRKPFSTHLLSFVKVMSSGVKITGTPGGVEEFVSLCRIAVYDRSFAEWDLSLLPETPIPVVFRLIPPEDIKKLSESFFEATGLEPVISYFREYLEKGGYSQREIKETGAYNYLGDLLSKYLGYRWMYMEDENYIGHINKYQHTFIRRCFYSTLSAVVAPVIVNDRTIAFVETRPFVFIEEEFDIEKHMHISQNNNIPWAVYGAALERTPRMQFKKMRAIQALVPYIAESLSKIAYTNYPRLFGDKVREYNSGYSYRSKVVKQAIRFMISNVDNDISIAETAAQARLTKQYFSRLFKRETGITPVSFLARLKIDRAKEYFIHSTLGVLGVAESLGYSRRQFTRVFKEHVGFTPREYLKHIRQL